MKKWHPELIPINREEGYHTHYIGKVEDGKQFFGYRTFAFPKGCAMDDDWQNRRREYLVVYIFDREGNYLFTDHKNLGTAEEVKQIDEIQILESMINELGKVNFENIAVKPFKTVIDDIEFGLIEDEEFKGIQLMPSSTIAFFEPWNGEYDT